MPDAAQTQCQKQDDRKSRSRTTENYRSETITGKIQAERFDRPTGTTAWSSMNLEVRHGSFRDSSRTHIALSHSPKPAAGHRRHFQKKAGKLFEIIACGSSTPAGRLCAEIIPDSSWKRRHQALPICQPVRTPPAACPFAGGSSLGATRPGRAVAQMHLTPSSPGLHPTRCLNRSRRTHRRVASGRARPWFPGLARNHAGTLGGSASAQHCRKWPGSEIRVQSGTSGLPEYRLRRSATFALDPRFVTLT